MSTKDMRIEAATPYIHIDPPRATYVMTAYLPCGRNSYRAYQTFTDSPAEWLARWSADWEEMAAELWDYEPPSRQHEAEPSDILTVLGLATPKPKIRRRI